MVVAHFRLVLVERDADHGLDLRAAMPVVLRHRVPAGRIQLDRIDAAGLGQLQSLEDLRLGVVDWKSFDVYIKSRLWAQPPIKLPPIKSRLIDTLPILPHGRLPGGMSVLGRLPLAGRLATPLRGGQQDILLDASVGRSDAGRSPTPRARKHRRSVFSAMTGSFLENGSMLEFQNGKLARRTKNQFPSCVDIE